MIDHDDDDDDDDDGIKSRDHDGKRRRLFEWE
jgi:hypothetical protein